ncbi:MAG: IS481 family transposase [Actinomycetota bacterium]|nr:IS481 family transposase [Actinomycetota bacterium]
MRLHRNAQLAPNGRLLLCQRVLEQGWSRNQAAEAAGVSERTASKWLGRYRAEGEQGLIDRPSTPKSCPTATPADRVELIVQLRHLRLTADRIAGYLGMALSTVSLVLKRLGLGKLSALDEPEPPNRYERRHPGELIHVDVKKLGRIAGAGHQVTGRHAGHHRSRGAGWEFVHVAVDDATRLSYVEVLDDERAPTAVAFLRRAVGFFTTYGVAAQGVMTDNGGAYRSTIHALACRMLGLKHLRTRPYRPRTNGKAERFIQTLLRGWAYGAIYRTSEQRLAALPGWLDFYNHERPHGSLSRQSPVERLAHLENNVLGNHS